MASTDGSGDDALLVRILERSRDLGFLGPGDPMFHVEKPAGFGDLLGDAITVLDLGSGGGVPGLVVASSAPQRRVTLLDGMQKRCRFLQIAAGQLSPDGRIDVVCGRAEDVARDDRMRGRFDAVTSRSFGPPAVTAECAAPFLRVGGLLVVSEPPESGAPRERWDAAGLAELGLADEGRHIRREVGFRTLRQVRPCPDRFPRRSGIPAKRPLFAAP
jgi:16S rRNA (guanine527-N7)-methyltransferase